MIPVFQDMSVVNDGHGNCFNACVASILERPLRDVAAIYPRVPIEGGPAEKVAHLQANENWHDQWDDWFAGQGYELVCHPPNDPPKGYSIASGKSSRVYPDGHPREGQRIAHAVVAFDGVPIHDPFPIKGDFDGIYQFQTLKPV
jgi:hypothetical protein